MAITLTEPQVLLAIVGVSVNQSTLRNVTMVYIPPNNTFTPVEEGFKVLPVVLGFYVNKIPPLSDV